MSTNSSLKRERDPHALSVKLKRDSPAAVFVLGLAAPFSRMIALRIAILQARPLSGICLTLMTLT